MTIVFATQNENKVKEIQALLPKSIVVNSLKDINCYDNIPETASTLEGNASLKSGFVLNEYAIDCFADDTGLEIEALNGEPGVYSARYAGPQRNADDNMNKLLSELEDKASRKAQFKTVIALHLNGKLKTFTGICKGGITTEKHGEGGFGYDPIFKAEGFDKTFAEISLEEKNKVGHRGKAVQLLIQFLKNQESNQS